MDQISRVREYCKTHPEKVKGIVFTEGHLHGQWAAFTVCMSKCFDFKSIRYTHEIVMDLDMLPIDLAVESFIESFEKAKQRKVEQWLDKQ